MSIEIVNTHEQTKWSSMDYYTTILNSLFYDLASAMVEEEINDSREIPVKIFDTTLRDGAQTAEKAPSQEEAIEITKILCNLGIDFLEVGFPVSVDDHTKAVTESGLRESYPDTKVVALARVVTNDIDKAQEALAEVNPDCRVIHTFIAASELHRRLKLGGISIDEVCKLVEIAVGYITQPKEKDGSQKFEAMFSPEDATNTPFSDLKKIIESAVKSGAKFINIPDTLGTAQPFEIEKLIRNIKIWTEYLRIKYVIKDEIVISYHPHNDSYQAVACALAAIRNGATMIQGTLNGMGERSGNLALCQFFQSILVRPDLYGRYILNVNMAKVIPALRAIDKIYKTNYCERFEEQFLHASGIHQAQVCKSILEIIQNNPTYKIGNDGIIYNEKGGRVEIHDVYQPIRGSQLGANIPFYGIVLTKHSGKWAILAIARLLGYDSDKINDEFMDKFRDFIISNLEQKNIRTCTPQEFEKLLIEKGIPKI